MKKLDCWKKVLENDLDYIVGEIKNLATSPAVIILSGDVGAGKTTFSKKFVGLLSKQEKRQEGESEEDTVLSPTYSIINDAGNVAHADFYRLNSKEDLIHLELPFYIDGKDYFLVEWGRPYLQELQRQIDNNFKFYEVSIEVNQGHFVDEGRGPSRNFCLYSLD